MKVTDVKASGATVQKRSTKAAASAASSTSEDDVPRKQKPKRFSSPLCEEEEETKVPDADLSKVESPTINLDFLRGESSDRTPVPSPESQKRASDTLTKPPIVTNHLFGDDSSSESDEDGEEPSSGRLLTSPTRAPSLGSSAPNRKIRAEVPRHLSYANALSIRSD